MSRIGSQPHALLLSLVVMACEPPVPPEEPVASVGEEPRFRVDPASQLAGIDLTRHVPGSRQAEIDGAIQRLSELLPPDEFRLLQSLLDKSSGATVYAAPGHSDEVARLIARIYAIQMADAAAAARVAKRTAATRHPARMAISLVEDLEGDAQVVRRAGPRATDLILLRRSVTDVPLLSAALLALAQSRESTGVFVRQDTTIPVIRTSATLTRPEPQVLQRVVTRLRDAPVRDVPGHGTVPTVVLRMQVVRKE